MPLTDLLQWIDSARKTGTLVLESPEHTTTLFLKDGRIISSSSTDPKSYLGQFLLAQTALTEDDLRRAFERQEKTKVYLGRNIYVKTLLGKILLDEGLLPEKEITRILRVKTEETVYNAFLWPEGSFKFHNNELPPEELVPISLDIVQVLNRGVQRMEEWKDVRSRIPSNHATFRIHPGRVPAGTRFDEFSSKVLVQLGEGKSVLDIMLDLHTTEFAVNRAVFGFLRDGFVELEREEPPPRPPLQAMAPARPAAEVVEKGRELLDPLAFADTVVKAREKLQQDPADSAARRLLEHSERRLTESFYARLFAPGDIPELQTSPPGPAPGGKLSPEERFLLDRVNGKWNISTIVKLSPLKEVDALAILKKFLDQGLIAVKRGDDPGAS